MLQKIYNLCVANTFSAFSCFMRDNQHPLVSFNFSIPLLTLWTFSITSTAATSLYWIILVCLGFSSCRNQSTLLIMLAAIPSPYLRKLRCSCALTYIKKKIKLTTSYRTLLWWACNGQSAWISPAKARTGCVSTKTPQTDNAAPTPTFALTHFHIWIQASHFLIAFQKEKATLKMKTVQGIRTKYQQSKPTWRSANIPNSRKLT